MKAIIEQLTWNELLEAFQDLDSATGTQLTDLCCLALIEPTADGRDVQYTTLGRAVLLSLRANVPHVKRSMLQVQALLNLHNKGKDVTTYLQHSTYHLTADTVQVIALSVA